MILDAGERHIGHTKTGDGLNKGNHGRTEYHKGMAPLVLCVIGDKRGVGILAFIQEDGVATPETAHTVAIPQTQQSAIVRERILCEELVELPLRVSTGIGIVLVDNQIRQAVFFCFQNQADKGESQARISLGLAEAESVSPG